MAIKGKYIGYILVLLLQICSGVRSAAQVVYPVEANVQLITPYSLYLNDYTTGEERLKVNLFLKDLTKTNYPVRLKLTIDGFGTTITSKNEFYTPPIYLDGGQLRTVAGPELQDYLNTKNLVFQGIDASTFRQNGAKLPEGIYRITFQVEDYTRRQIISNAGTTILSAFLSYPPIINLPLPNSKVTALFPQHIVFQWTPRHTASVNAAFNVAFSVRLVEVNPPTRDPNDAIRSSRPIFETITDQTQLVYGPAEPQLTPGNTYALQVQAIETEGRDAFVNNGYSEIVRFVYGEKCSLPLNVLAQVEGINSLKWSWVPAPLQQSFGIRYREAGNTKAQWFEQELYTPEYTASGMRPGKLYEYQVKAECGYGYGEYTTVQQFTMPDEALTEGNFVCGQTDPLEPIDRDDLLAVLTPGMIFQAGAFPVRVTEVGSSTFEGGREGAFSGKGTIGVPYLNKLSFNVVFEGIRISRKLKLVSGKVSVARQTLEQGQDEVVEAITVTPDEKGVVEAVNSNGLPTIIDAAIAMPVTLPVYNAADKTVTFKGVTDDGETKEITIKLKEGQPPFTFQDKHGETYTVDQTGKVTALGKQPVSEFLAGNTSTNKPLVTDKATVIFKEAPGQQYGLDIFKEELRSNSQYTKDYQKVSSSGGGQKEIYISWKSVESLQHDEVVAEIQKLDNNLDLSKIEFRNSAGEKLPHKQAGDRFTITVLGAMDGVNKELYAFYPTGANNIGLHLGKLNIASYKKITKKVVVVPVNGAGADLTETAIRNTLNSIYKQAVVEWQVTKAANFTATGWDNEGDGLDVDNSGSLSAYTPEQKALAKLYKKDHALENGTYYIFLVNKFSRADQQGYMVRNGQVGFVATNGNVPHTIAHELGHGAFALQHTWEALGTDKGATTNLMDYGSGTELWHHQWVYMRNPDVIFRPLEGDDEGASHDIQIEKLLAWIKNNKGKKAQFKRDEYFTSSFKENAWVDIPLYFDYNGKKYTAYAEVFEDGEVNFELNNSNTFSAFDVRIDHQAKFHTGFKLSVRYASDSKLAFTLWTYSWEDYQALLNKLAIGLPEASKNAIATTYQTALKEAGSDCNKLDVIYENIPDFVGSKLGDELLWSHLKSIANCSMENVIGGTDEEKAALNILKIFSDKSKLYQWLYHDKTLIAQLYDGVDGENAIAFVSILDELVRQYGQVNVPIKEFVFLGETGEAYKGNSLLYRKPYILGETSGFNQQNEIVIDCFIGRANMLPTGWGTAERRKDISKFTVHPLAPIRVYVEEQEQATLRPAIYAYYLGARQNRDEQLGAINNFTNILGLSAAVKTLTVKGAGLLLKTLATIEIGKLAVDQAMMNKQVQQRLQQSEEGRWFVDNWPVISITTDISIFSVDILRSLVKDGPKVSQTLREAGEVDAAHHIDEIIEQARRASHEAIQTVSKSYLLTKLDNYSNLKNWINRFDEVTDASLLNRIDQLNPSKLAKLNDLYSPSKFQMTAGANRVPVNSPAPFQATINGKTMHYNSQGFPDFKPYSAGLDFEFRSNNLTGSGTATTGDFKAANDWAAANSTLTGRFQNIPNSQKCIVKFDDKWIECTWHHYQDGRTMFPVPSEIHNAFRHTGGKAIIERGLQDIFE
jgi:hypothetical protein